MGLFILYNYLLFFSSKITYIFYMFYNDPETEQDPVGPSQAQKLFCVPHFLLVGKRVQPPRPSLSSKG